MEHVAWSLTAPHTPFEPCMMGDDCAGKRLANVYTTKSFVLKAYVSPQSRALYERTGVLQPVDEHSHPHPGLCIVDLLALVTCMANKKLADNEASGCIFPPFYNPSGRPGTYAPSALCGFSKTKLNGVTRAYRYFLPDQLVLGRLGVVVASADPITMRLVRHTVDVDALLEVRELVEWRPECETDPNRAVWLHDARPGTAPQTRPAKPPVAAEVHHAAANTLVTPRAELNSVARLAEARKPVEHLLPRMPAPLDVAYATVAPPAAPAASAPPKQARKRASRATQQPAKRKAAEAPAVVAVKSEPVDEPPNAVVLRLRSIVESLRGGRLKLDDAPAEDSTDEAHLPKN